MNRATIVLAALLAVSAIANGVLVLRGRPHEARRPAAPIDPPPDPAIRGNGELPCGHEAEIARLRGEVADLKARIATSPTDTLLRDQAIIALQRENERLAHFWSAQERVAKAGRSDPQYAVNAINAAVDHLELPDGARTRFFDAARLSLVDIDRARAEMEEVARRVREAGGSPNDAPEWLAANSRLADQLRGAARRLRETLDATNPRQNGFALNVERWVHMVAQPYR
jgi:hypothetical protein